MIRSFVVLVFLGLQFLQTAPPAPQIPEAERLRELAARRQEVQKRIGERAVLVLFSAEPRVYTNDVDYPYRQENNLYYLTGIKQAGITLVMVPGAKTTRELLFAPPRDPRLETWNGKMMSAAELKARSGVQTVVDSKYLGTFLATIAPRAAEALPERPVPNPDEKQRSAWRDEFQSVIDAARSDKVDLYLLIPSEKDSREYKKEQVFASALGSTAAGLTVRNAAPIFGELRLRKSEWEIKLLKQAADITSEAFHRVFSMAAPGVHEYEVQAEFEYTFRRRNADSWGYPCIVGGGENATTLHYITNQDRLDDSSLLLMDCAAEYDHYTADITRTLPVSGKFNPRQAEIYRIVYEAQEESIKAVWAGNVIGRRTDPAFSAKSVHGRSVDVIKEGLLRLGLITSKENEEYRIWFMHGTSHWLGMNVHDVGDYSSPLAPGMVLTVEPGIYIRPDALDVLPATPEMEKFKQAVRPAFEKYKGIGVRIEDDILVTSGDPINLSGGIPRKLEDVENTMARLRKGEVRSASK